MRGCCGWAGPWVARPARQAIALHGREWLCRTGQRGRVEREVPASIESCLRSRGLRGDALTALTTPSLAAVRRTHPHMLWAWRVAGTSSTGRGVGLEVLSAILIGKC